MTQINRQRGFTIVELMIASLVFSVVLLVVTYGLLQIARVYYKGITSTQTQERARSIMDEIAQDIQFSGGRITNTTGSNPDDFFCAGNKKYSIKRGYQLVRTVNDSSDEATGVLVVYDDPACSGPNFSPSPPATPRELMSLNMRLTKLDVQSIGSNLYKVTIRVVYGDKDVLNGAKDACASGRDGTQFCAVSELSTTVLKRLK